MNHFVVLALRDHRQGMKYRRENKLAMAFRCFVSRDVQMERARALKHQRGKEDANE